MKRYFACIGLVAGLALSAPLALAQSSPSGELSPAQATALAKNIIEKGASCAVLRALDGMDQAQATNAVHAIANAGQQLSPGSMAVVSFEGDPGNTLLTLNYVNQKTHGPNQIVLFALFSKAHPLVGDPNSSCSY